jgi:transcriptional regulator of acetoin/glycerol metabolism
MLERPIIGRELPFKGSLQDSVDHLVRARIVAALDASEGNRAQAARALDIDRATLWRWIRRLGI